jgi:hypothetical protein
VPDNSEKGVKTKNRETNKKKRGKQKKKKEGVAQHIKR